MPSTTFDARSSDLVPDSRRIAFERRANQSLASYFASAPAKRTTETHAAVAAVLATFKPHHRAALMMHHTPRTWPEPLAAVCGTETSLVVRLYCSDHPAVGNIVAELEAAAATTLSARISAESSRVVDDLHIRATDHFLRAQSAFFKALEAHRSATR